MSDLDIETLEQERDLAETRLRECVMAMRANYDPENAQPEMDVILAQGWAKALLKDQKVGE